MFKVDCGGFSIALLTP
ncbi:hypothetical protein K6U37_13305 [Vibrio parahaemolyticus]|nr:hypothetical protein [Vibrio parahaemolyticus]MCG6489926.1 hypothetical protein [Vibrio parahaemolyticus]